VRVVRGARASWGAAQAPGLALGDVGCCAVQGPDLRAPFRVWCCAVQGGCRGGGPGSRAMTLMVVAVAWLGSGCGGGYSQHEALYRDSTGVGWWLTAEDRGTMRSAPWLASAIPRESRSG
jgi:hypothetical protein